MNNENIKQNIYQIKSNIEQAAKKFSRNFENIKIIAVSKTHPVEAISAAYYAGATIFGENYVQELVEKQTKLYEQGIMPEWHFIGHLQTNKVKYIAPFISLIHSVDSEKLALEISRQAEKHNRTIDILLQINTSGEISKFGCEPDDAVSLAEKVLELPNIKLKGLMTIGTFSDDETIIRKEFRLLRSKLEEINKKLGLNLTELSMGMSHDYEIA
ncbi:MAG TPA: YggS family pyridoxal phosphate-dependent enzyme, partial [Candidatus Kapabacteria bacterium]|nr:YggS family pyridoxal phosphate-dependent enzyme [Candidatus Kapabacteria bacterium]